MTSEFTNQEINNLNIMEQKISVQINGNFLQQ